MAKGSAPPGHEPSGGSKQPLLSFEEGTEWLMASLPSVEGSLDPLNASSPRLCRASTPIHTTLAMPEGSSSRGKERPPSIKERSDSHKEPLHTESRSKAVKPNAKPSHPGVRT